MTIEKYFNGDELTVSLTGRLDTTTAPDLQAELMENIPHTKDLFLNLAALEYLSSAGLRVLLAAQKEMSKRGRLVIKNVNDTIMEVFELTGFSDVLNIE